MPQAERMCQSCHGTGVIRRPYMVGMKGGDIHTITVCNCTKGLKAVESDNGRVCCRAGDWMGGKA